MSDFFSIEEYLNSDFQLDLTFSNVDSLSETDVSDIIVMLKRYQSEPDTQALITKKLSEGEVIVTNAVNKTAQVPISSADTASLKAGAYHCGVKVVTPDNKRVTAAEGLITLKYSTVRG